MTNKARLISGLMVISFIIIIIYAVSCKKEEEKIMKVRNDSISAISIITATANATIIDIGQGISQHGHCWSTESEPTVNDEKTLNGQVLSAGIYTSNLTGLSPDTRYYVRAYIEHQGTVVYGEDVLSFTTLAAGLPEVTTGIIKSMTAATVTVTGNLVSTGTGVSSVAQHGHCWSSETTTPTIDNGTCTSLGTKDTTGDFESVLVGFTQGTLYYVRAYATNSSGTSYGDTLSFTTGQAGNMPTVTTKAVSSVTATSAVSGGNVTSEGGSAVTSRGVCWNTTGTPSVSDNLTTDGAGAGTFSSNIDGLSAGTTYYVRAYAVNSSGIGYGSQESFTTLSDAGIPTVTTTAATAVTTTSAVSGGNVTSDGGSSVTVRGVCWNTTGNPEVSGNHTTDGSGTGSFTSNIYELSTNTTYFVRAYATNSVGTGYGTQEEFTTLEVAELPTVLTTSVYELFLDGATITGNVTSDGGAEVTERGVCWNITGDPTISDNTVPGGSGTGMFSCTIAGQDPGTIYSVRAYATNSVGTNYGDQMNYLTLAEDPNAGWEPGDDWIDTRDDQVYGTIQMGSQVWMTDNLNYGKRIDGMYNSGNNSIVEKYCYDDDVYNCDYYGGLYQWTEMMDYLTVESSQGICPSGWHIPSDGEWKELEMTVGMSSVAADSINKWRGNYEAYNLLEAGLLSVFPGRCYWSDGEFYQVDMYAYFWSSSYSIAYDEAYYRAMGGGSARIWRSTYHRGDAYSARCVKD